MCWTLRKNISLCFYFFFICNIMYTDTLYKYILFVFEQCKPDSRNEQKINYFHWSSSLIQLTCFKRFFCLSVFFFEVQFSCHFNVLQPSTFNIKKTHLIIIIIVIIQWITWISQLGLCQCNDYCFELKK